MATIKNIVDSYTINVPLMTVNGNLIVNGGSTNVDTTNTSILDNIITLNKGEQNAGVSLIYSGIEIDRGLLANVDLRWNEEYLSWQITTDGSTYANIATVTGSSSAISSVEEDPAPVLGGNLNITGHTLYDTDSQRTIYSDTLSGGGSGVYSAEIDGSNPQELVTKSKALAFSIIFG